ncbi:MAG: transposase, partial [Candidatus Brocadiia bacterium]
PTFSSNPKFKKLVLDRPGLPPYSPELNLIEYVWGYLKEKVTNNYYFGEMDHLLRALKKACRQLAAPESKILSVDFKTHNYLPEAA